MALVGYLLLVYPNLSAWAPQGKVIVNLNIALGWFYSVIVLYVLTITITENWPYSDSKTGFGVFISSIIGNFALGTVWYFVALWMLKSFLVPPEVQLKLGDSITAFAAQLGVCWVWWLLMWPNCFGNFPTQFGKATNIIIRLIITFVLGIVTFHVYYNGVGVYITHEAQPIVGNWGGDALMFIDWIIIWLFAYAFAFNFWPFVRKA